jgi:hypothetical protein
MKNYISGGFYGRIQYQNFVIKGECKARAINGKN